MTPTVPTRRLAPLFTTTFAKFESVLLYGIRNTVAMTEERIVKEAMYALRHKCHKARKRLFAAACLPKDLTAIIAGYVVVDSCILGTICAYDALQCTIELEDEQWAIMLAEPIEQMYSIIDRTLGVEIKRKADDDCLFWCFGGSALETFDVLIGKKPIDCEDAGIELQRSTEEVERMIHALMGRLWAELAARTVCRCGTETVTV